MAGELKSRPSRRHVMHMVAIGNGTVGKTAYLNRFAEADFEEEYVATLFDNFATVKYARGIAINLNLWDTAGQEDMDKMRKMSYKNKDMFIVCFAINDRESLEAVDSKWIKEIRVHAENTPFMVIACKGDMRDGSSTGESKLELISVQEIEAFKEMLQAKYGSDFVGICETSAKTDKNVNASFDTAMTFVLDERLKSEEPVCCSIS